jgi:hypothetical protein
VDNRTTREDQEVFISFLLDSEDFLLAILAMLSSQQKGIEEMGEDTANAPEGGFIYLFFFQNDVVFAGHLLN